MTEKLGEDFRKEQFKAGCICVVPEPSLPPTVSSVLIWRKKAQTVQLMLPILNPTWMYTTSPAPFIWVVIVFSMAVGRNKVRGWVVIVFSMARAIR